MIDTIIKFVSSLEYVSWIAFVVFFGITIMPSTMLGAIVTFIIAAAFVVALFFRKKVWLYPASLLRSNDPTTSPLIDAVIIAYTLKSWDGITDKPFYAACLAMFSIDFLLWIVLSINEGTTKVANES